LPTRTIIRFGSQDESPLDRVALWSRWRSPLQLGDGRFTELDALRRRDAFKSAAIEKRGGRANRSLSNVGRQLERVCDHCLEVCFAGWFSLKLRLRRCLGRWFKPRQFLVRGSRRTFAITLSPRLQMAAVTTLALGFIAAVSTVAFAAWSHYARIYMAHEIEGLRDTARLEAQNAASEREHLDLLGRELRLAFAERDRAAEKALAAGTTLQEQKIDIDRLVGDSAALVKRALAERDRIALERDRAIAERDEALAERDAALVANREGLARLDRRARNAIADIESFIASTGVDPARAIKLGEPPAVLGGGRGALPRGGPFVPWRGQVSPVSSVNVPRVAGAAEGVERLSELRDLMVHLPLASPLQQVVVSGGFGFRIDPFTGTAALHEGVDMRGALNSPVYATAPGTVSFAGWHYDYGNMVEVDHGFGLATRYAHLGKLLVKTGDPIALHQELGLMGATGRVTAVHLHYEVRVDGRARNPLKFLKADRYVPEADHPIAAKTSTPPKRPPFVGFELR